MVFKTLNPCPKEKPMLRSYRRQSLPEIGQVHCALPLLFLALVFPIISKLTARPNCGWHYCHDSIPLGYLVHFEPSSLFCMHLRYVMQVAAPSQQQLQYFWYSIGGCPHQLSTKLEKTQHEMGTLLAYLSRERLLFNIVTPIHYNLTM